MLRDEKQTERCLGKEWKVKFRLGYRLTQWVFLSCWVEKTFLDYVCHQFFQGKDMSIEYFLLELCRTAIGSTSNVAPDATPSQFSALRARSLTVPLPWQISTATGDSAVEIILIDILVWLSEPIISVMLTST